MKMKQKDKTQKIAKDTTIGEIVEKYPQAVPDLLSLGLHCVGCHVASFESLEEGFKAHGMDDKQVDEAIKKLNKLVEKSKK